MANINPISTFALPSPYEQQMLEAKRRQQMAELLQQQAGESIIPQQGRVASKASPWLGAMKAFEASMAGYNRRKADEAQVAANQQDIQSAIGLMQNLPTSTKVADVGLNIPQDFSQVSANATPTSGVLQSPAPATTQMPVSNETRKNYLIAGMLGGGPTTKSMAQMLLSQKQPSPADYYGKIDPKDYTPESRSEFDRRILAGQPANFGVLQKIPDKQEKVSIPDIIQQYNFARQNDGYTGTLQEWILEQKRAGAPRTNVSVDTKAGNEIIKPFVDKISEGYQSATASKDVLSQIDSLERLTKSGTFTGAMAPKAIGAAQFLESFGIKVDPKTLANSRAFEAQKNKLVLDFMNASGGARGFAREETAILMDAFPKIVDSPEARQQILDTLRRKSLREIQNYNNNVVRFKNAYPNAVIPFDPIETEEDQYQRWKQSRGGK